MIGQHALERLTARVAPEQRATLAAAIESTLSACKRAGYKDAAVRVWRDVQRHAAADGSNGQCAVLIVRNGQAATLFWRRVTQAHTSQAYGVQRVLCARGTCTAGEHRAHR